jgi:hypothetical protein
MKPLSDSRSPTNPTAGRVRAAALRDRVKAGELLDNPKN